MSTAISTLTQQSLGSVFGDEDGVFTGRDARLEKAASLLDGAPAFAFRGAGPALETGNLGLLRWEFGPVDQPSVVTGSDSALAEDGRIRALDTRLDA